MAGALITGTIEDRGVLEKLAAIQARAENMRPVWAEVGQIILESIQRNFQQRRAPDGTPWQPVSAAYARWKSSKGKSPGNILNLNGLLQNSIHTTVASDSVTIGTNVPYAAIHQFGGEIKKKERKSTVYFHRNERTGEVGRKFVEKSKSNFAQDVAIGEHTITMPKRPFLGARQEDWGRIATALQKYIVTGET